MFDTFGYAMQAYERVRMNDPTGPLADPSLMAMGNAYFRHGQYENAAYNYDLLRKEYPNSEHQMLAHLLGFQAKMRVYQGTCTTTALKEAHKIADPALTQFGEKLGPEQARVVQAQADHRGEGQPRVRAGPILRKNKYYGAARYYYKDVIDEYPRTEKANRRRSGWPRSTTNPDMPPNYFKWLTDLFPASKKR